MKILSNKKYNELMETYKEMSRTITQKNYEIANLQIELEDTQGFLRQEKECSAQLRKERSNLRRLLTKNGINYKKGDDE